MARRSETGQFGTEYDLSGEYSQLHDDYGGWVTSSVDKNTTSSRLKAGVRAWLHWCQETQLDPLDATENDVRRYIKKLVVDNFAETTITRQVATVSKYYHFLITDPDSSANLETNPTQEIHLRKDYEISNKTDYVHVLQQDGREDIIAPSYEQIQKIFDHVPGERGATETRNRLICTLLWQTAVRSDELSRMKLENIDWDNRDIKIRSSKLNKKDHPKLYKRHVWWEENLDYLMHRWKQKRSQFDPDNSSPYLFVNEHGKQMSPSYMSRIVKDAAHSAGINEPLVRGQDGSVKQWLYTAHRLRHARITHLANDPVRMDLNSLRMMAGHASFDTTLSYVRADWDTAQTAYREALQNTT